MSDVRRGKAPLLSTYDIKFICDVYASGYRKKTGMEKRGVVDEIMDLRPETMKRRDASQVLRSFVIPKKSERGNLNPNFQRSQSTPSKPNTTTLEQQFLWHTLVEKVFNNLQDKNTVWCKNNGKIFGEVIPFLGLGRDEM